MVLFFTLETMYSSQPSENHDATRLTVADILSTMASTVDAMTPTTVSIQQDKHLKMDFNFMLYFKFNFLLLLFAVVIARWFNWSSH